jgi:hypothetical protein
LRLGNFKPVRAPAAALGLIVALIPACTGNETGGSGRTSLQATRADGSTIELPERVRAWCGPTVGGEGGSTAEELQVLGGELPEEHEPYPFWIFSRPTQAVEEEPRFELPEERARHASFFVLDVERRNELSSAEERASGTIEVVEWGCERNDEVRIEIDAVLDSELHGLPTARVEGDIVALIGDPVPPGD